jgi:hypothetical protein
VPLLNVGGIFRVEQGLLEVVLALRRLHLVTVVVEVVLDLVNILLPVAVVVVGDSDLVYELVVMEHHSRAPLRTLSRSGLGCS